jgi:hypothetical protein
VGARICQEPVNSTASWVFSPQQALEKSILRDGRRLPFAAELDLVGPVSTRVLPRQGCAAGARHAKLPVFEFARGGAIVTGSDEAFGPSVRYALASSRGCDAAAREVAEALAPRRLPTPVLMPRVDQELEPTSHERQRSAQLSPNRSRVSY